MILPRDGPPERTADRFWILWDRRRGFREIPGFTIAMEEHIEGHNDSRAALALYVRQDGHSRRR